MSTKPVPCCNCTSRNLERLDQTEIVYNEELDCYVCVLCGHCPVWIPADKSTEPSEWRAKFSQDLRDLLATWNTGERPDDYKDLISWHKDRRSDDLTVFEEELRCEERNQTEEVA